MLRPILLILTLHLLSGCATSYNLFGTPAMTPGIAIGVHNVLNR